MQKRRIILASKSARRKKMLEQLGLEFEAVESEYNEDMAALSEPYELVKFLAFKKAEAVAKNYNDALIIGADNEMVAKLLWLQFVLFARGFVRLAQNDFHRNAITAQTISLVFLASAKKS